MLANPTPRKKGVADVNCPACGMTIYLDENAYLNFQGPVVCVECRGRQEVVIQNAELVTPGLVPDIDEPIRDILAWAIP